MIGENSDRDKICLGCKVYLNNNLRVICQMDYKKDKMLCPCSSCLIKMVCEIECTKIEKYSKIVTIRSFRLKTTQ